MIMRWFYLLLISLFLLTTTLSCKQPKVISSDASQSNTSNVPQVAKRLVESSNLIVVGNITNIYDGTHLDAGMSYDVEIEKVIHGEHSARTLHFASPGGIAYAEYKKGEKVLLFLANYGQNPSELQLVVIDGHQVVCYIRNNMVEGHVGIEGPLGKLSLDQYLELIKEVKKN